jgi:hypothetical protein
MGLAAMLAVILLLEIQGTASAPAALLIPQTQVNTNQTLPLLTTTLLVGTSPDYWPMEYYSGTQIVGHDINLMNALTAEMSVTVVYKSVPWGGIFTGLIAGEYDLAISGISITPERDTIIDYTLPYVTFAGNDRVAIAIQEGNSLLRRQLNEALWRLRDDGTLATNVANIAADVPEGLPQLPVWPYVPPDAGSTLLYTDSQQSATTIQIPGGAVPETVLVTYTPLETATSPSGLTFAGHAFDLDVYRNGTFLPASLELTIPATLTLHYTDSDIVGLDEASLVIEYWNQATSAWEDASCASYLRSSEGNWVAVPICHLSRFALFGKKYTVYLPLVLKNLSSQ